MRSIIGSLGLLAVSSFTMAISAPTISGVTGQVLDGQVIQVSGSGFGNGPDVVVFDDFESGTAGVDIATNGVNATIGGWDDACPIGACENPAYTTNNPRSGNLGFLYNITTESSNWRNGLLTTLSSNEIFFSEWVFIPNGNCIPGSTDCSGSNWKTNWLLGPGKSASNGDRTVFTTTGGTGNATASNAAGVTGSHYFNPVIGTGRHTLWQFYIYADATTGIGDLGGWGIDPISGATYEQWIDKTGINVQSVGEWTGKYHYLDVGGYASSDPASLRVTFDDIYVAQGPNARARVMIGNAATLATSTNVTLCTNGGNADSWSSTSISCSVRAGSFVTGQTWIYVVDGNGATSAGFGPIDYSGEGGGGGDPSDVAAPENLRRDDEKPNS